MKNNIHNTNFVYFISANNLTAEKWDFLGKAPIRLTEKSYYFDLINVVELIGKIYRTYYWEIVPMCFEICFRDKERNAHYTEIMTNDLIQRWFKLFREYDYLTNDNGYNYTTSWKLMCSMFAQIYTSIQEQRSIKVNEKNIKETSEN